VSALGEAPAGEALRAAARNAVRVCLAGRAGEKGVIVCDEASRPGCAAIAAEMAAAGIDVAAFVIEELGPRPVKRFPPEVIARLEESALSVFWAVPVKGELRARTQLLDVAVERKLRHAHVLGIGTEHFVAGLAVDYRVMQGIQRRLVEMLRRTRRVRVASRAGTRLAVELDEGAAFAGASGIIAPGRWENLPSGQVMCVPAGARGTFVADRSVGEWFGAAYGDISATPLVVEIEEGRLVDARSENRVLAREFLLYVRSSPNGDRLGELGIGTNIGFTSFTGLSSVDELVPGCHVAFGSPPSALSAAVGWEAATKVPLVSGPCDLFFDAAQVMSAGTFAPALRR